LDKISETEYKWAGCVAQAVKSLPSIGKALGSNFSTKRKKEKKTKNQTNKKNLSSKLT
jgi:hypothetical protein